MIKVKPHTYKQLEEPTGVHFFLITNTIFKDEFIIEDDNYYESCSIYTCDRTDEFPEIIGKLPLPAHVLVISPKCLFLSPSDDILGQACKLLVMPCNSTPITLDDISYAVHIMKKTDIAAQQEWADNFFEIGESSTYIIHQFF
ncbi:hypothetical protein NKDENANG_02470 [Candidatus Entotheonellaceae bacterium PAL068K]